MIGIIASMESEFAFKDQCELISKKEHACFNYEVYLYEGIELVTAVCGTGKVSAAICTQLMIEDYHPEMIINIGTAGSLTKEIRSKDIIIAEDSIQHDFDVSPFGWRKAEQPELGMIEFHCDETFVQSAKKIDPMGYTIHFGRILSGDRVVVDEETKTDLTSTFGGLCVEMEGAAIGQVCAMNHIAYAIIRGVSDGDTDDQKEEFFSNIDTVAEINGKILLAVLLEHKQACSN